MVPFLFTVKCDREGGNKKAAASRHAAARSEPIRFTAGEVNRVTRIGAFSWGEPKKLPWKSSRSELIPEKGLFPQRAGDPRKKHGRHRQLFPVMSGIGSGSQCLTGLGIPATLQMAPSCDLGSQLRGNPVITSEGPPGPAEPQSASQYKDVSQVKV